MPEGPPPQQSPNAQTPGDIAVLAGGPPMEPYEWDPPEDADLRGRFSGYVTHDGWVYWRRLGTPEVRVRVDATGPRIAIIAVLVLPRGDLEESPATVRASDLRDVPLGQIEAMMNSPELAEFIRKSVSGENIRTPLSKAGGETKAMLRPPTDDQPYLLHGVEDVPRPDDFYADLADKWSTAVSDGHKNPAAVIAGANGVSSSAVHRWAREARRRGVMAPSARSITAQRKAQRQRSSTA